MIKKINKRSVETKFISYLMAVLILLNYYKKNYLHVCHLFKIYEI